MNVWNLTSVKTFAQLIGVQLQQQENVNINQLISFWNYSGLGNRCREFAFKFFSNKLGLNIRVCNFVQGVDAECTLCAAGLEPAPRNAESFLHLFFECAHAGKFRESVVQTFFPLVGDCTPLEKKLFWMCGTLSYNNQGIKNSFVTAMVLTTNFMIWEMKLQKSLLPISIFKENLKFEMKKILSRSAFLREEREKIMNLCRL